VAGLLGIGTGVLKRFSKLSFVDSRFPGALQPIFDHPMLSDASKRKILNDNTRRLYPRD